MPRLFSYGTLQQPAVQKAAFGRLLEGTADVLAGYRLAELVISDRDVVDLSGELVHKIACRTGSPTDRIAGLCFEVTEQELESSDNYEVDAYWRTEELLESGVRAFVYVAPQR